HATRLTRASPPPPPPSPASGRGSAPRSRRRQLVTRFTASHGPLVPAKAGPRLRIWIPACAGMSGKSVGRAKAPTGGREAPPRRRAHAREKTIMSLRVACPRRSAKHAWATAKPPLPTLLVRNIIASNAPSPFRPVGGVAGAGGGGAHVHVPARRRRRARDQGRAARGRLRALLRQARRANLSPRKRRGPERVFRLAQPRQGIGGAPSPPPRPPAP